MQLISPMIIIITIAYALYCRMSYIIQSLFYKCENCIITTQYTYNTHFSVNFYLNHAHYTLILLQMFAHCTEIGVLDIQIKCDYNVVTTHCTSPSDYHTQQQLPVKCAAAI